MPEALSAKARMPTSAMAVSACSPAAMNEMTHAAPDGLFVGDHIRGDDRLAVARTHGMHHAIDEGERGEHHCAGQGMIAFRAFGDLPVARSRCRLCCVRKTQPKIPLNAPGDCCAVLGAANAEGGDIRRALRRQWIDRLHLGLGVCREDDKYQRAEHG